MTRLVLLAVSGPDTSTVDVIARAGAVVEIVTEGRPLDVLARAAQLCSGADLAEARRQLGPGGHRRGLIGGFLGAVAAG